LNLEFVFEKKEPRRGQKCRCEPMMEAPEPVFVNVSGAQQSIPPAYVAF